jgi:hypothetical protein
MTVGTSLYGFIAGADDSPEQPLGEGGVTMAQRDHLREDT